MWVSTSHSSRTSRKSAKLYTNFTSERASSVKATCDRTAKEARRERAGQSAGGLPAGRLG